MHAGQTYPIITDQGDHLLWASTDDEARAKMERVGFAVYAVGEATRDEILKGMRPSALRRRNGGTR